MKRLFTLLLLSLLLLAPAARADGPDERYVTIYNVIQEGDAFNDKKETANAMAKYAEAQTELKKFATNYPDWNIKVVKYRLKYLAQKISDLSSQPQTPAVTNAPSAIMTNTPSGETTNAPASTPPAANPAPEAPAAEPAKPTPPPGPSAEDKIHDLQEQIRGVEADKALLQAKLKEALAAQPATVDPQDLTRAQERIKELEKKNDLLQATLDQAKTNVTVAPAVDETTKASLAEATRKVSELNEENAKLAMANEALQAQVKKNISPDANASALRAENEILKKQLAQLESKPSTGSSADETSRQLKESQAQIATLQSDKEMLRLQKMALEDQVKKLMATSPSTPASASVSSAPAPALDSFSAGKIAQLEAQRDALQKTVDAVTKDLHGKKKGKAMAERIDDMARQIAMLQSSVSTLEASPMPYSSKELALMGQAPATLVASASARGHSRKAAHELPAGAARTLDDARHYFMDHQLDKAEDKYLEVLKLDEKNIVVLADLASIEMELNKLDLAEQHINAALAVDANDDYNLFVLGQIKFREGKYDDAFAALSQAAQINPQNAKVQNFLGLTLSEKGMRGPAETAFRKAIQFDPDFAQAHMNLAVVYITQTPPLAELAKWHYQKAISAGAPPKPDLEKLINGGKTAEPAH